MAEVTGDHVSFVVYMHECPYLSLAKAANGPESVSNKQETLRIDTYQYWRIRK